MQTTIRSSVTFRGKGLHSGRRAQMTVHPASAGMGVWFRRTDVIGCDAMIAARWSSVCNATLCTEISNEAGVRVSTIEHLMAALAGCGIHNALIEIDGPEVPILDGSAAPFAAGFLARGVRELEDAPLMLFQVLRPVEVRVGDAVARLDPAETLEIAFSIAFEDAAIGTQQKHLVMANGAFLRELSDSRTFCRQADVDDMRARGLALGGEPGENAVVFDGDRVSSPGGLRHKDEPVRHKMLDALGDLALAGAPILGRYTGHRAGHAMTNRLLRALFADPTAYRLVECDEVRRRDLPGARISRADIPAVA
ncbi:MAG: UDP-3-O-acyl-N-acetylglucosamine deacetylase [Defluviimonas sp.]|uniref:UDP-3-O-acyl-N-acetylglucosamine deacetylase n=1 Tax=Albidovulum sp. TaxID=1872424 RepID=UPI002A26CBEE|nr:UDP-3-O-acyl-N-acetylglucosamine deacetylase [Defluviimonas sp.]